MIVILIARNRPMVFRRPEEHVVLGRTKRVAIALEPQPTCDEAFAKEPDLVLDLTFSHPEVGMVATGSTG